MREWLAGLVGENLAPIVSVVVSVAIVVLLALVIIGLAKRVFAGSGGIGGRSRAPRLAILDVSPVDPKRKLVLVRRDDTEHLLLIGGQNDLVVESGIQRVRTRRVEPPAAGRAEPEVPVDTIAVAPQPQTPQRRVPPPVPAPTPIAAPFVAPREVAAPIQRATPAPVQGEAPEPADLRVPPVLTRALPQDPAPERVGERPLPTRAPSEERGSPAPEPEPAAPALPAFLGVMTNRPQPAVRPQPLATAPMPAPSTQTRPPIDPPRAEAARPIPEAVRPEAAVNVPPAPPRSMATPTLPSQTPLPGSPRAEPSVTRSEPEPVVNRASPALPLVDEPLLATEANEETRIETRVSPPNRTPEARVSDDRDEMDDAATTPERQPLSVRSFATTIQARRATPMPPVAASAAAPPPAPSQPRAPTVEPVASKVTPTIDAPRPPEPEERREEATVQPERGAQSAPAAAPPPARTLTLEEEMERLLHDFTLDVTDRR